MNEKDEETITLLMFRSYARKLMLSRDFIKVRTWRYNNLNGIIHHVAFSYSI